MEDVEEVGEDGEEGEIKGGFLGEAEMENRRNMGEAAKMSWVEAVLLCPGRAEAATAIGADDEDGDEDDAAAETEHGGEPPPPGTAADRPPPSASANARLDAALVHKVTALLGARGEDGDHDTERRSDGAAETLVETLAEAAADGIDVARWLGHGRSSIRGRTPLMEAARLDQTGCCAVLAEAACAHGTGLNAGNEAEGRNSALHYACSEGAGGSVCELLVRGADPGLRNREGETALQAALANGQAECADLVRDFLRRPTFEPNPHSGSSIAPLPPIPSTTTTTTTDNKTRGSRKEDKGGELGSAAGGGGATGREGGGGGGGGGGGSISSSSSSTGMWGVTGVPPEVCRANAVFCLGRRRRRLGASVRPARGLGVGVGTAAAELGLGARRGAQLHATNPCSGTAMEAFALWSIASGQDPFYSEGGGGGVGDGGGKSGIYFEEEQEQRQHQREGRGRGAAGVWLEHYVRVYNESLRRWYSQPTADHTDNQPKPRAQHERSSRGATSAGAAVAAAATGAGGAAATLEAGGGGAAYALVVKQSKALAEGRRFDLPIGADLVVGRSQSLADLVVKDETVSKRHLRMVNLEHAGVRLSDLGSKHGAVVTKPAPHSAAATAAAAAAALAAGNGDDDGVGKAEGGGGGGGRSSGAPARPAGLGGKDPPAPPKQRTFFPIPIPREPEWVAGAHGDRISLGKTVFVLEREGGPEPPSARGVCRPGAGAGAGTGAGAERSRRPAPAVIAKGFAANPNLMGAIRTAQEEEKKQKKRTAASELATAAAAQYLSNNKRRARSTTAAPTAPLSPSSPSSAGAGAGAGVGVGFGTHQINYAAAAAAGAMPAAGGAGGQGGGERQSFDHVSKGSMLLRRMGWKEGQGLGVRSEGQLQPIQVERRGERAGLGSSAQGGGNGNGKSSTTFAVGPDGRVSRWELMRRRFSDAQSSGPGFGARAKGKGAGGGVTWLRGKPEGGGWGS